MSPIADVADAAVSQLLRIPEALEKLAFPPAAHRHHEHEEKGEPPVDIMERPTSYVFYVDLPGLSKSEVQVAVEEEEKVLVVRRNTTTTTAGGGGGGKRKRGDGEEEEGCRYLRLERRAAPKFERRFRLPEDANPADITAKCENGVLTVTVERVAPAKPKTVQVPIS